MSSMRDEAQQQDVLCTCDRRWQLDNAETWPLDPIESSMQKIDNMVVARSKLAVPIGF